MKRIFLPFAVMLSALFVLTSCLGDDEDEMTYPSDAAIIAFSLGNANLYTTLTSSTGADSIVKSVYKASDYKFYIDQVNRTIYNPDSLPYGTDVAHMICVITSKNSGNLVIKEINNDSLRFYHVSDSIDFSVPRVVSVYSLDGSNHVNYTVTVNVKKSSKDYTTWEMMATKQDFESATGMKAVSLSDKIYLFASYGNTGAIYTTGIKDGVNWDLLQWNINSPIPANAYKNVVVQGDFMYLYHSGAILRSSNGEEWEQTGMAELSQLVAASSSKLYALDEGMNLISTADGGRTWKNEQLDDNKSMLPTRDISYACIPSEMNSSIENVVLIGNRDLNGYPDDNQAQIWNKVEDNSETSYNHSWMHVNPYELLPLALPRLTSLTSVAYDGGIVAIGSSGFGACKTEGFEKFYLSTDGGIYWGNSNCYIPSDFKGSDAFTIVVDKDKYLWIICGGSGQVWRSRLGSGLGSDYQYAIME